MKSDFVYRVINGLEPPKNNNGEVELWDNRKKVVFFEKIYTPLDSGNNFVKGDLSCSALGLDAVVED